MFEENVYKFISENDLINRGTNVGVAVSGGADSVCMLHVLHELSQMLEIKLFCLHFEHGIRGHDSVLDMEFTRSLCKRLDIPFISSSADVPKIAVQRGENLENMGRKLRYEFFLNTMKAKNLSSVCLAHHSADVAESVLLNMIRGSGISGVSGIAPIRPDGVVRPMLFATKAEILKYVHDNNLRFCTDKTNFDVSYSRNFLREKVIPELERINPNAVYNIYRTAQNLRSEGEVVHVAEGDAFSYCAVISPEHVSIDIEKLCDIEQSLALRVIRKAVLQISPRDIEKQHLLAIYDLALRGVTGKKFETATYRATVRYSHLVIYKPGDASYFHESINIPGITPFPGGEFEVSDEHPLEMFPSNEALYQYVNPDLLKGAVIRMPNPGDTIVPFGRTTEKKLARFLMDKKVPRDLRNLPILAKDSDVLWVPGVGLSEKMRVHDHYARLEVILNAKQ